MPKQLIEDIKSIPFATIGHRDKGVKFINNLLIEGRRDNFDYISFREKSSKYLRGKKGSGFGYGGRYKEEFLDLLMNGDIIQSNNYSSKDAKQALCFRINPKYFTQISNSLDSVSLINYKDKQVTDTNTISLLPLSSYNIFNYIIDIPILPCMLHQIKNIDLKDLKINFITIDKGIIYRNIDSIKINYTAMLDRTQVKVSEIKSSDDRFKIDSEIKADLLELNDRSVNRKYWTRYKKAMQKAQKKGLSLIKEKNKYYLEDLDKYISDKKDAMMVSYMNTINAFQKGYYRAKRNSTNRRLDSIITSMGSYMIDVIKKDNDLVEIDLINSQFAILANWLMTQYAYKNSDVRLFCKHAIEGHLYEYIAEQLNPDINIYELNEVDFKKVRREAKDIMMGICFSSYKSDSEEKELFSNIFPNVTEFIHLYMKSKGDSALFAIHLQNLESRIFIDGLMRLIMNDNMFVLTKHDSLIVRRENLEEVKEIIYSYFNEINFKASIKIDGTVNRFEVTDARIQDETIPATDNTQNETGADKEEKNAIYAGIFQKIEKEYKLTLEIKDRKMDYNSVIALEQMSDKYKPAKELLELIRA